jgi:hypothetical protein
MLQQLVGIVLLERKVSRKKLRNLFRINWKIFLLTENEKIYLTIKNGEEPVQGINKLVFIYGVPSQ